MGPVPEITSSPVAPLKLYVKSFPHFPLLVEAADDGTTPRDSANDNRIKTDIIFFINITPFAV